MSEKAAREKLIALIESKNANTVFEALGIELLAHEPSVVVGLIVDRRHLQHAGVVHGGIFVLLAESAASIAAALAVDIEKYEVSGMEINANHVRKVASGQIKATAQLLHQGRSHMVYSINVTNSNNELVSISRCTIAVRKRA